MKHYTINQLASRFSQHILFSLFLSRLIRCFASRWSTHSNVYRLAPMFAKASKPNRLILLCLYLAGTIDTWRATGATMPPLARSIYRSRGITCESQRCLRSRVRGVRGVRACVRRLSSSLGFLERRRIHVLLAIRLVIYRGLFRRLLLCSAESARLSCWPIAVEKCRWFLSWFLLRLVLVMRLSERYSFIPQC